MGEVYLAQDTKLDRKVALKILPLMLLLTGSNEALCPGGQGASALNHPNIITIHEIDDGQ